MLAAMALVGFAANSLLCRMALHPGLIDAASFTAVRIGAGAVTLLALAGLPARRWSAPRAGSWGSAVALFCYAAAFSYSYLRIGAGAGALLLFGSVQATMLLAGLRAGERLGARGLLGLALALSGLVILVRPGLAAPDPLGAGLMVAAGGAWGVYSVRGRAAKARPLAETASNFARCLPFAAALLLPTLTSAHASPAGLALAAVSGAIASGLGYTLWYAALPSLGAVRAAIVQLSVPVLTAAGASLLLGEPITLRLVGSSVAILGGVALALLGR
jgi:drug/metabolite transporter (DMT)-like permease